MDSVEKTKRRLPDKHGVGDSMKKRIRSDSQNSLLHSTKDRELEEPGHVYRLKKEGVADMYRQVGDTLVSERFSSMKSTT